GRPIATESITLGAMSRLAISIPERFRAAANRNGVMEISSSIGELSVLGLRFNPRAAFTSVEAVTPRSGGGETISRTISQIADGDRWKTTIVLVNNGTDPAPFSLSFRAPDGSPLAVPVAGKGAVVEVSGEIPTGGSRTIETEGASDTLLQGWAEIVTPETIGGTAIFGQRRSDGSDTEGAVAIAPSLGSRFVLPFDNTLGFVTAMAALNDTGAASAATITFRDEDGQVLAVETLSLGANSRTAFALPAQFPRTGGERGTAEFSAPGISVLGLRFNPLGAFTSLAPVRK
ncbi:MAG: hypothetical protein L0271_12745, partial [Gemmatimonadetes bacterium]|nr:hypothetical protein [Gemmatimonadota bacterium]